MGLAGGAKLITNLWNDFQSRYKKYKLLSGGSKEQDAVKNLYRGAWKENLEAHKIAYYDEHKNENPPAEVVKEWMDRFLIYHHMKEGVARMQHGNAKDFEEVTSNVASLFQQMERMQ